MGTSDKTPEQQQCRFQWGECSAALAKDGNITHRCAKINIVFGSSMSLHDGVHHCIDCGLVYLTKRYDIKSDEAQYEN